MSASPFLTVRASAEFLGVSVSQIYALRKEGKLKVRRHGARKGYRIHIEDLQAYSEAGTVAETQRFTSKFQDARNRLRSLKTEDTAHPLSLVRGA